MKKCLSPLSLVLVLLAFSLTPLQAMSRMPNNVSDTTLKDRAGDKVITEKSSEGVAMIPWREIKRTGLTEQQPVGLSFIQQDGKESPFVIRSADQETHNGIQSLKLSGFIGEFPTEVQYFYESENAVRMKLTIEKPQGTSEISKALVGELVWSVPLKIAPRKRVWMQGNHGVEWEERYFYNFFAGSATELLQNADRNEWRYFVMQQLGQNHAARIWKQESRETSPLMMQDAGNAVPAMQVFDQQGGVTFEFPSSRNTHECTIELDATYSGQLNKKWTMNLDDQFKGFSDEIVLTVSESKDDLKSLRSELAKKYPTDPVPQATEVMQEEEWLRKAPSRDAVPQYVSQGYPFSRGELNATENISVSVDGKPVPIQAKPLAYWPDQSIKWALLTFPLPESNQNSASQPDKGKDGARVTFRNQEDLSIDVRVEKSESKKPEPPSQITVAESEDGSVTIKNEPLTVELQKGRQWLREIKWNGKSILDTESKERLAYTDFWVNAPKEIQPFSGPDENAEIDRGELEVDSIKVEESGPLRSVVRLEGLTTNREPTRIVLRLEMTAGSKDLKITHTAVFRFSDPRTTLLTEMGVAIPFSEGANADTMLVQQTPHVQYLNTGEQNHQSPAKAIQGYRVLDLDGMKVQGTLRNFWKKAPSSVGNIGDTLKFGLWPKEAGVMDVRRYSNYPHRAQGESAKSATDQNDWVETKYYPIKPFYGIASTHEMLITFDVSDKESDSIAADFQSPPLLYAGWDRYDKTRVVLPTANEEDWPHSWAAWTNITNFFLWHQKVYDWYGLWNYGDVRHRFQNGYGWILSPELLMKYKPWESTKSKRSDRELFTHDYRPYNDWPYDNGRWGWSNTEGLGNLLFQNEYLRHGNRALYFQTEALARHSRDTVTRNEGPLLGDGTRHGVQPWSDGNHEERQTTATEYRVNYFLSGDGRTKDVSDILYENAFSKKKVTRHAGHSGRLIGLLLHWEMSGDPAEGEQFKKYVHSFLSPDGLYVSPQVQFPGPTIIGKPEDLNVPIMFFHSFGGLYTLIEYYELTKDEELAKSLITMADKMMADPHMQFSVSGGAYPTNRQYLAQIAFAARYAENPKPYKEFLMQKIREGLWQSFYQPVADHIEHWSGQNAFLVGNVSNGLFIQNWMPFYTYALGGKEIWDSEIEKAYQEKNVNISNKEPAETSWQTEFDGIEELQPYIQQPWLQNTTDSVPLPHQNKKP